MNFSNKNSMSSWLLVSFFIDYSQVKSLLSNFLIPFTFTSYHKGLVRTKNPVISINSEHGENLRFSILATQERIPELATELDESFKVYCIDQGLNVYQTGKLWDGVFLEFEKNSVQYGLYNAELGATEFQTSNPEFNLVISKVLLEVFRHEPFSQETILTLVWYLFSSIVDKVEDSGHSIIEKIQHLNNKTIAQAQNTFEILYGQNLDLLMEITQDVSRNTNDQSVEIWLKPWQEYIETIFTTMNAAQKKEALVNILKNIYICLDLNPMMTNMIEYFMERFPG